jgi:hypothetical protein
LGITVRVQAKRHFKSGKYESLDGTGQQIKDLRQNCRTTLPIYVFYNDPTNTWPHASWLCKAACSPRFRGESAWGCSFAAVTSIPALNKPNPSDIRNMHPLHCLVGPCFSQGGPASSLPISVANAIRSAYYNPNLTEDDRFKGAPSLTFEASMNAPTWAKLLLDKGDLPKGADDDDLPETVDLPDESAVVIDEYGKPDGLDEEDDTGDALSNYLSEHGLKGIAVIHQLFPESSE